MKNYLKSGILCLFALLALGACEKKVPNDPTKPTVLNNQFEYGKAVTKIASVVYTEEEGLYTFYLSPTANVSDVNGMVAANDFVKITTTKTDGAVDLTLSDNVVSYKDITSTAADTRSLTLNLSSEKAVAIESEVKAGDKSLRVKYDGACVKYVAGTPEPVELNNEFEYGTAVTKIASVVYTEEEGLYTFYLSPTADIADVEGMTAADDFVKITTKKIDGEVDLTAADNVVSYKDIVSTSAETRTLTLNLSSETAVAVESEVKAGDKSLRVKYDGACVKYAAAPVPLVNQFRLNGEVFNIKSAVAMDSYGTFMVYLLQDEGIDDQNLTAYFMNPDQKPSITVFCTEDRLGADVSVDEAYYTNHDFYYNECSLKHGMDYSLTTAMEDSPASGSFRITKGDKMIKTVSVAANLTQGDSALEINYSGGYSILVYTSQNGTIGVLDNEYAPEYWDEDYGYNLRKENVFVTLDNAGSITFAIGDAADPASVQDLMNGNAAAEITVSLSKLGEQFAAAENPDSFTAKIYDYTTSTTYALSPDEMDGEILVEECPNGREGWYHIYAFIMTADNMIQMDYYGEVTMQSAWDIKPVPQYNNSITIVPGPGASYTEPTVKDIIGCQSREGLNEKIGGGYYASDSYYFYFIPQGMSEADISNKTKCPRIRVEKNLVNKGEVDVAINIATAKYGESAPFSLQYSMWTLSPYTSDWSSNIPDKEAKVKVSYDEATGIWDIHCYIVYSYASSMMDMSSYTYKLSHQDSSTNEVIEIHYTGTAAPYTNDTSKF